jgi:hypothetical protein
MLQTTEDHTTEISMEQNSISIIVLKANLPKTLLEQIMAKVGGKKKKKGKKTRKNSKKQAKEDFIK